MKQHFIAPFFLFIASISIGQCLPSVHFNQKSVCAGEDLLFTGFNNGECAEGALWIYTWQYNSDEILLIDTLYSPTDSSHASLPQADYYEIQDGITLFLTVQNDAEVEIADDNYGHSIVAPLFPIQVNYFGPMTVCNINSFIPISGGISPYSIEVDDQPLFNIDEFFPELYLALDSGIYHVHVTDAMGCTADSVMAYLEHVEENQTCDAAIFLQNQTPFYWENECSELNQALACETVNAWSGGWFSFNTGDYLNASLIFVPDSLFGEYILNAQYCFELFQSSSGTCDNLNSVYCDCVTGGQVNLSEFVTLLPNTVYYLAIKSNAAYSYLVIDLDDTFELSAGCSETNACNYLPTPHPYEVCLYPGCMDALACNFDPFAICDDNTCIYPSNVCQVYYDLNENGHWNVLGINPEMVIGGVGYFTVLETGLIIYPDADGRLALDVLGAGVYTLQFTDENNYWQLSTGLTVVVDFPSCSPQTIGIIPENNSLLYQGEINKSVSSSIHCVQGADPMLVLKNYGNQSLTAVLSVEFNPNLTVGLNSNAENFEQTNAGTLIWNINQKPGSILNYGFHIYAQGIAPGEQYEFEFVLTVLDQDGIVMDTQKWTYTSIVSCTAITNSIQADPEGYQVFHYILPGEEVKYTIQYSNSGEETIDQMRITDWIDLSKYDLGSFVPSESSHPFNTVLEQNGHITFIADHIHLPEYAVDPTSFRGFVSFRIRPKYELPFGEVIHNVASIFADELPAEITNTTWHTIFDCELVYHLPWTDTTCAGNYVSPEVTLTYVDQLAWYIDEEFAGNQPIVYTSLEEGNYQFQLIAENELCTYESVMDVTILPTPDDNIELDGTCLFASQGVSYQWYLNDIMLPGETQIVHCPNPDLMYTGGYHCLVTGESGCVTDTEYFFFVSTEEILNDSFQVFPNPVTSISNVQLPQGIWNVSLLNSTGQLCKAWNEVQSSFIFERVDYAAGQYVLLFRSPQGASHAVKISLD